MLINGEKSGFRNMLTVALFTALSTELYFSVAAVHFRISPAVLFFAFFLLTLGRRLPVIPTGAVTMGAVFIFRGLLWLIRWDGPLTGTAAAALVRQVFPGAVAYLVYGALFSLFLPERDLASDHRAAVAAGCCDLIGSGLELGLRSALSEEVFRSSETFLLLILVVLVRTLLLYVLLTLWRQYHWMLNKEEHEQRYRQLFLLTAELKNEVYLMKKNSEQIEGVMKEAYLLYEELKEQQQAPELQSASLNIAREVHDIKKDYYRLIQGMEAAMGKNPREDEMDMADLFRILRETGRQDILSRGMSVTLETELDYPFRTVRHYPLMSILMNLVVNAIEAMDSEQREGRILIREDLEGENIRIRVSDSGKGISARRLPHIFEMGYSTKFDQVTGNIYRGVGLVSVKQLAEELLKGSIEVESREGSGTCFTLRFPLKELAGDDV